MPLVTVVVPVYKVEKYLETCVQSILAQTHQRLEVLLIDDGSPDGSPAICDRLAQQDGRIRVIHQHNQGLSVARNTGLDAAAGEFVAFVDSDDWIEPDMIEVLLKGLVEHGADLAAVMPIPEVEDGISVAFPHVSHDGSPKVYGREEALEELLRDQRLRNFAWSYLYRASLFEGIRFPAGQRFEDIHTTYRIFLKCSAIVALPVAKYHYRIRRGSITQAGGIGGLIEQYEAHRARHEAIVSRYPRFRPKLLAQQFALILQTWCAAGRVDRGELDGHRDALQAMAGFAAAHRSDIIAAEGYGRAGRLLVWFCANRRGWAYRAAWLLLKILDAVNRRARPSASTASVGLHPPRGS